MLKSEIILSYFPELTAIQKGQFEALFDVYKYWNDQINVVSRKDFENIYINHVLHSLGIAKVIDFLPHARIMDVGTGGGFPGIPLAILFPESRFYLVDSIQKKIKVVNAVKDEIGLINVETYATRAEQVDKQVDFIVSRAVTRLPEFVEWVQDSVREKSNHSLPNGILYLKGGDLTEELAPFHKSRIKEFELKNYFKEDFFETKKVVYLNMQ